MTLPLRSTKILLSLTLSATAIFSPVAAGEYVELAARTDGVPPTGKFDQAFRHWHGSTPYVEPVLPLAQLRPLITTAAERYKVSIGVILAVIRNGSGFDTNSRTRDSGVGLMGVSAETMQLAAPVLAERDIGLTNDNLMRAEVNIAIGTAALHALFNRTFARVKNPLTRRYVVLAAYRAGIDDVVRAMAGKRRLTVAISRLNRLPPGAVYRRLMQRLKFKESKLFLAESNIDVRRWERSWRKSNLATYYRKKQVKIPDIASVLGRGGGTAPAVAAKPKSAAPVEVRANFRPVRIPTVMPSSLPSSQLEFAALDSDLEFGIQPPALPLKVKRITRPVQVASVGKFDGAINRVASRFRQPVLSAAKRYAIPPSVILSMMKNESAFDPKAVSRAGALGLMQLMPKDGGREALSFLLGRDATPSRDVLFKPAANIEMGTAYLHLLMTRYLGKIEDDTTRLYAAVAAYNTGPSNVARALLGRRDLRGAVARMNAMTSDEVYRTLVRQLPYGETKVYLARVRRDMAIFRAWDSIELAQGAGTPGQL